MSFIGVHMVHDTTGSCRRHRQQQKADELNREAQQDVEQRQVDEVLREPDHDDGRDAAFASRHDSDLELDARSAELTMAEADEQR